MNRAKDPILRSYEGRCTQCYMRCEHCICALIPHIQNKTYVTVLMHHRESYKTTNTARIACMALTNSRIYLRGLKNAPLDSSEALKTPIEARTLAKEETDERKTYQPLLLTLSERSETLSPDFVHKFKKPIHLIVPDGNWRQASKMGKREPHLQDIPWIKLPPGPKSNYKLRHEHHPEGLSTLEAIARALAIIEGDTVSHQLIELFDEMVRRTLLTRPMSRNNPTL